MSRRSRLLVRDWRRAWIVVVLAVSTALGGAYAIASNDLHAVGIDPVECIRTGMCVVSPSRRALPAPAVVPQSDPYRPEITVTISHRGVHERIHLLLPAHAALAQGYLAGHITLERLAADVGSVSVDDDDVTAATLKETHLSLSAATLTVDLDGDPYSTRVAEERTGAHTLTFRANAASRATILLRLDGFRFANAGAFSLAPDAIADTTSARWNAVFPASTITVQTTATSGVAPYAGLRTAVENAGDATGWPALLVGLLGNFWGPFAFLVLMRGFPRSGRRTVRRLAATLIGTATVYAFGTAFLAALHLGAPWAVLSLTTLLAAAAFVTVAYRLTGVPLAMRSIGVTLGVLAVAIVIQNFELSGSSLALAPAIACAVVILTAIVTLGPRTFARACAAKTPLEPAAWAIVLCSLAITTGASHVAATISPTGNVLAIPQRSLGVAVTAVFGMSLTLFGFVTIVLGRGLDPRAPRALPPWMVNVVLSFSSIGLAYHVLGVPVAALLGLVTIPLVALRPWRERLKLATARVAVQTGDDPSFDLAVLRADVATARGTRRRFEERFVAGELSSTACADAIAQLKAFVDDSEARLATADPGNLVASFFTSFPFAQPLAAARSAAVSGAVVAAIVLGLALPGLIAQGTTPPLYLLSASVVTLGHYTIGAAAFALFLPFFRGSIATTKGIMFAFAIALAAVPVLWLQMPLRDALTQVAPTCLFFPLIGAIFDALALRKHAAALSVPQLFRLAGLGNFAVIGTVFLTGIATALTGQLQHAAIAALDNALKISSH